jgi:hypothetical protein
VNPIGASQAGAGFEFDGNDRFGPEQNWCAFRVIGQRWRVFPLWGWFECRRKYFISLRWPDVLVHSRSLATVDFRFLLAAEESVKKVALNACHHSFIYCSFSGKDCRRFMEASGNLAHS